MAFSIFGENCILFFSIFSSPGVIVKSINSLIPKEFLAEIAIVGAKFFPH